MSNALTSAKDLKLHDPPDELSPLQMIYSSI